MWNSSSMKWQREVTTGTAEVLTRLGTALLLLTLSLSPAKNIPDVDCLVIYIKKAVYKTTGHKPI